MGSFSRIAGSAGVAALAVIALGALSPSAQAAPVAKVVNVPCKADALVTAIQTANTAGAGTLRLSPRCVYQYTTPATAADALPVIIGDITLMGGPLTKISRDPAAAAFRLLDVASGAALRVKEVAIQGGSTVGFGGGIQNAGTLVLEQTIFAGNNAGNGGAVANLAGATATISRSLFSGNSTAGVGGGAILNSGTLTVSAGILSGNKAPINGGGLNTQPSGVSKLIRTTVYNNTSGGLGGGISNLGTTTLERALVERNKGSGGGGIATGNANVTITNSIIRANAPDNCNPLNTIPGCVN